MGVNAFSIQSYSILTSPHTPQHTLTQTTQLTQQRNTIPLSGYYYTQQRSNSIKQITQLFMSSPPPIEEEVNPGKVDGTDLRVLEYPHPSLRAENAEITKEEIDSGEIKNLAKEMFLVMYATNGVGLAAPQVGINKKLMVYNESGDSKKWLQETIMINPKIIEYSDAKAIENEGCLSFPDMRGDVERSKWIKVESLNVKGKKQKKKFKGWEARIFQHEYDHLEGVLYPDRMTEESKEEAKERLEELVEDFGEGGAL